MTPSTKPYLIVVGIDYSEESTLALRQAFQIASERPKSEVHVVHVQTSINAHLHSDPGLPPPSEEVVAQALQRVRRLVAEELASFQAQHRKRAGKLLENVVSHVRLLAPGEQIAQLAADLEADLVVVGTHGRTGVARLLLGSVAHAVVTLAPCPVLVVREKKIAEQGPGIEPPCPRCVDARKQSAGLELWCEQHRERHGRRHTFHQSDRAGQESNFPLVFEES